MAQTTSSYFKYFSEIVALGPLVPSQIMVAFCIGTEGRGSNPSRLEAMPPLILRW